MEYTMHLRLAALSLILLLGSNFYAQKPVAGKVVPRVASAPVPPTGSPEFLFLADIHLNREVAETARKDDTGTILWDTTKKRLKALMASSSAPKFIIYTGDLTAHDYQPGLDYKDRHLSQPQLDSNMAVVLKDLYDIAGNAPLFYAPGNNDALEGDYANFADPRGKTPFSLIDSARMHYPAPNAKMVSHPRPGRGYYSARPFAGLRIIALNTVILGKEHWTNRFQHNYVAYGDTMLQWLADELKDVKTSREKAYLIMHIPPGIDAYSTHLDKNMWDGQDNHRWQSYFLRLTEHHQDDIAGIFYGHTHMDEIRLLTKPGSRDTITEVAISGPGVSPNHGQNPAYKTVTYSSSTFEPTDFTTYYTNQYNPTWAPSDSYTFSEKYNFGSITDLTGPLPPAKLDAIRSGLRKTYKAGKGEAGSQSTEGLLVE